MGQAQSASIIELRVERIERLFESLDPSPFHERDLDRSAAAFITDWARDLPEELPLTILIHVGGPPGDGTRDVAPAIRTYYGYHADAARRDLRELFAMGRRYLIIGLVVLSLCILGGQLAVFLLGPATGALVREGLIILGWVANWKPFQTFLYDWVPIVRRQRLLRRLAEARVELVPIAREGSGPAAPPRSQEVAR
jgi:hypothetical protein